MPSMVAIARSCHGALWVVLYCWCPIMFSDVAIARSCPGFYGTCSMADALCCFRSPRFLVLALVPPCMWWSMAGVPMTPSNAPLANLLHWCPIGGDPWQVPYGASIVAIARCCPGTLWVMLMAGAPSCHRPPRLLVLALVPSGGALWAVPYDAFDGRDCSFVPWCPLGGALWLVPHDAFDGRD